MLQVRVSPLLLFFCDGLQLILILLCVQCFVYTHVDGAEIQNGTINTIFSLLSVFTKTAENSCLVNYLEN